MRFLSFSKAVLSLQKYQQGSLCNLSGVLWSSPPFGTHWRVECRVYVLTPDCYGVSKMSVKARCKIWKT